MTWKPVLALLLAVSAVAACGDDDDTTTQETTTTTEAVTTTAEATTTTTEPVAAEPAYVVTVEDPGQEPRRELRLSVQAGDVDPLTLRQEMAIEVRAGGQVQSAPSPITEFDITYTVDDVDGDQVTATGRYDDVRVLDTPGVDPAVLDETRQLMEGFRGARALTSFTTQGAMLEVQLEGIDLPPTAAPFVDQMTAGLTDSIESLSMPFPDEAIGAGARWRIDTETEVAGLPVAIATTIQLTELTDDRAAGTIAQTMQFIPGDVQVMGVTATIISGELDGDGTIEWDLTGGVVPRSDMTIAGGAIMEANGMRIEQIQEQHLTYRPR